MKILIWSALSVLAIGSVSFVDRADAKELTPGLEFRLERDNEPVRAPAAEDILKTEDVTYECEG